MTTTRLFVDWIHVEKGQMVATLDPERISEEGQALIERHRNDWGIYTDTSGHGMKRNRLPYGVKITIEKARKSAPWLREDKPWEQHLYHMSVIHENGRYRCWYGVAFPRPLGPGDLVEQTFHEGRQMDLGKNGLCYAESEDGLHWVKPALGIYVYDGSTENNIVAIGDYSSGAVFRDDAAPEAERYKCFLFDRFSDGACYGLFGSVSPDGYHWTRLPEPLLSYFHDTQNVAYWDDENRKYVGYFRGHLGERAISYSETDDFRRWPSAEVIAHSGPMDAPGDDYYTNGFTRYPDEPAIKLIFNAIYHHSSDLVDVRLGITHNNRVINWVSYDPIVEHGRPGDWDCAAVYTSPNMVRLPDGTIGLPYHGVNVTHNEDYEYFYKDFAPSPSAFAWALWDDGRLAGIETEEYGEFWTRGEGCTGAPIEINARTSKSGSVEVELWESVSQFFARPIPGFTFDECIPFRGDEIWTPLQWRGKKDLSELKGKTIQLRIRLTCAKIFGYRWESSAVLSWKVSEPTAKAPGGVAGAPCLGLESSLDWKPVGAEGNGFVNIHHFGSADGIVYFANRFSVSQRGRWEMNIGSDGGVRVFVDGESVLTDPETRNPAAPGRSRVEVDLETGEHEVVIAFDLAAGRGYGIFFSWGIPESEEPNNPQRLFPLLLR